MGSNPGPSDYKKNSDPCSLDLSIMLSWVWCAKNFGL